MHEFVASAETLEKTLESNRERHPFRQDSPVLYIHSEHLFIFITQRVREFVAPAETLEKTLESNRERHPFRQDSPEDNGVLIQDGNSTFYARTASQSAGAEDVSSPDTGVHSVSLSCPQCPHSRYEAHMK